MRYIQLGQHVLNYMPRPFHIESIDPALEKLGVLHRDVYVDEFETRPKRAKWGTGLFYIEADGQLTLIDSDWDTSD